MGCLATRACPVTLTSHRFDHLLDVERLGRFAQNFVGGSQSTQSLRLIVLRLLRDPLRLERYNVGVCIDRLRSNRFALRFRGRFAFADCTVQALGGSDVDLLAGSKVSRKPSTTVFLTIDLNLDLLAGDVRIVLLSAAAKIRIPEEQIADDLASGAPQNKDGTISLVAYAAWMLKEMSRGE